jgi:hypothetical protein
VIFVITGLFVSAVATGHWVIEASSGSEILGSISCSQFSAMFPKFRRKNGVFLENQCYDPFKSFELKSQFFRLNFRRKYFLNRNIGPRNDHTRRSFGERFSSSNFRPNFFSRKMVKIASPNQT